MNSGWKILIRLRQHLQVKTPLHHRFKEILQHLAHLCFEKEGEFTNDYNLMVNIA